MRVLAGAVSTAFIDSRSDMDAALIQCITSPSYTCTDTGCSVKSGGSGMPTTDRTPLHRLLSPSLGDDRDEFDSPNPSRGRGRPATMPRDRPPAADIVWDIARNYKLEVLKSFGLYTRYPSTTACETSTVTIRRPRPLQKRQQPRGTSARGTPLGLPRARRQRERAPRWLLSCLLVPDRHSHNRFSLQILKPFGCLT